MQSNRNINKPHRRTGSVLTIERYSHQCDNCQVKFNWDASRRHSGTYRDIEENNPVATFCCADCKAIWKAKQAEKSKN